MAGKIASMFGLLARKRKRNPKITRKGHWS